MLKEDLPHKKINTKTLNKCQGVLLVSVEGDLSSRGSIEMDTKRKKKDDIPFQLIEFPLKIRDVFGPCLGKLCSDVN